MIVLAMMMGIAAAPADAVQGHAIQVQEMRTTAGAMRFERDLYRVAGQICHGLRGVRYKTCYAEVRHEAYTLLTSEQIQNYVAGNPQNVWAQSLNR